VIHPRAGEIHPATRAFQALRIAVNGEFSELVEALYAAENILPAGGILAVVTFHSLEDRIVKRFFRPDTSVSRHMPARDVPQPAWADVRKPVHPGEAEIARNPRSRSATLRSAVRSNTRARELSFDGLGVPEIALADF
jgi:16S rRNA (cytosine1402-N4)-methyltransferase